VKHFFTIFDTKVSDIPSGDAVEEWAKGLFDDLGFKVMDRASAIFGEDPLAYYLVFILEESHMIVRAVPEQRWIEIECCFSKRVKSEKLLTSVRHFFKVSKVHTRRFVGRVPEDS
jgi:S-adenosylmethionine/arginine decarboxylase-like enzyme